MQVVDSLNTLISKYYNGDITLDQYYSGVADLSFVNSNPGATYNNKPVIIK